MLNYQALKIKKRFVENNAACSEALAVIALLTGKSRFRILCLLREGDFCVSDIVEVVNEGKISNISQQLRMLTLSGIVEKFRQKNRVFYHLKDEKIGRMIDFIHDQYLNEDR